MISFTQGNKIINNVFNTTAKDEFYVPVAITLEFAEKEFVQNTQTNCEKLNTMISLAEQNGYELLDKSIEETHITIKMDCGDGFTAIEEIHGMEEALSINAKDVIKDLSNYFTIPFNLTVYYNGVC